MKTLVFIQGIVFVYMIWIIIGLIVVWPCMDTHLDFEEAKFGKWSEATLTRSAIELTFWPLYLYETLTYNPTTKETS